MSIPFIDLKSQQARIRDKIDTGLAAVLDHGAYIMGPKSRHWKERLAKWSGAKHNISVPRERMRYYLRCRGLA